MPRKTSIRPGFQQVFLHVPSATQSAVDQYSPEILRGTRFESRKYEYLIKTGLEVRDQAEANAAPRPQPNARWQNGARKPKTLILGATTLSAVEQYRQLDGSTKTNALLYFVWLGLDQSATPDSSLQARMI